jgi:hypothetical protein
MALDEPEARSGGDDTASLLSRVRVALGLEPLAPKPPKEPCVNRPSVEPADEPQVPGLIVEVAVAKAFLDGGGVLEAHGGFATSP